MLSIGIRTVREIAMDESSPLSRIHEAILEFARGRNDIVVFGAHAVNAYVPEPRMTQDVDLLALDAKAVAEDLRASLAQRFDAAVRVRELQPALAYRVYQIFKPANRHLADIRGASELPSAQRVDGVLVPIPAELIAQKVVSLTARRGRPKAGSDWRDIAALLLVHPRLMAFEGEVLDRLRAIGAPGPAISEWESIVKSDIKPDEEEY